jgi:hypothetical protein
MALSISSSKVSSINFTLSETNGNQSISISDSMSLSSAYSYGSGNNQITNASSITGVLPSGGSAQIDLYSFPQTTFDASQNVQFTGVKNFSVYNTSTTEDYDFTIASTGSNACTNLFNGGSGNLLVKPYSGFTYNDPYDGFVVSASQRYVYLDDLGSGVTYKIFVLGLD